MQMRLFLDVRRSTLLRQLLEDFEDYNTLQTPSSVGLITLPTETPSIYYSSFCFTDNTIDFTTPSSLALIDP